MTSGSKWDGEDVEQEEELGEQFIKQLLLEKWFPLQGERGHSSYFWSFQKQNREEGMTEQNEQAYKFTQGYNFSTDYKNTT